MTSIDFDRIDALTFDCYGTLIDWETGISRGPAGDPRAARRDPDRRRAPRGVRPRGGGHRGRAVPALPRGARPGRPRRGDGRSGSRRRDAELAAFGGSVGDWPAFEDTADALAPAQGALPPRGHHELRRRPVRGLEPPARRDVRLDHHGPAGRLVQAEPPQLRRGVRRDRRARASGSSTSPRACSTTTSRPRRAGWRRPGSTGATTRPARARRRRPRSTPDLVAPDMRSFADLALGGAARPAGVATMTTTRVGQVIRVPPGVDRGVRARSTPRSGPASWRRSGGRTSATTRSIATASTCSRRTATTGTTSPATSPRWRPTRSCRSGGRTRTRCRNRYRNGSPGSGGTRSRRSSTRTDAWAPQRQAGAAVRWR